MRLILALCAFAAVTAAADEPLLLQKPTLSKTHIVFAYAGDLWIVPRDGGEAGRLTSGTGTETDPAFSPDGKSVAFTGEYDGNVDVFVVPSTGGVPKRLTWHQPPIACWVGLRMASGSSLRRRDPHTLSSMRCSLFLPREGLKRSCPSPLDTAHPNPLTDS
jgi:tricorn protease-like protein